MTHTVKQTTFDYKGKTLIKGINVLSEKDALWVIQNSHKILFSEQSSMGIQQQLVSTKFAEAFVYHNDKVPNMMLNKCGDKLMTIIYGGLQ